MPARNDQILSLIPSKAGIKRDGTSLDGGYYTDGLWCRFRNSRPKKMGGFQEIGNGLDGPIRGVHVHPNSPQHIATLFSDSGIQCQLLDVNGRPGGTYSRTPLDFVAGSAAGGYTWTFDTLFDATGTPATKLIAHAASTDWANCGGSGDNQVWIGDVTTADPLSDITGVLVAGGVVVLQPFLFFYGANGLIMNAAANAPTDLVSGAANAANVAGTTIVKGLPLRGGTSAPAGLFWSLDSMIRVSWAGNNTFRYDPVAGDTSILCPNGVIEYDGLYFWPGIDRFLMYNGVIQELPNPMNQDFFFDNLNWAFSQKVWATTVRRWGEIWWFFPKGDSTECNHAIIYNVREKSWYDTPVDRSAGAPAKVLHFPVWADSDPNSDVAPNTYRIYRHETGLDAVTADNQSAIRSYFETGSISYATQDGVPETQNVQTRLTRIEPDFNMKGQMTATVVGASNAQAPEDEPTSKNFDSTTKYMDLNSVQRRVMRLRFESNTSGGDYHMGKTLLHIEPGDPKQ